MMNSRLDHDNLRVYQAAIGFVSWLEELVPVINSKVSACDHLARASMGVPVNIAEASGKRSMLQRRNFVDIAYGSSLECAACLDILRIHDYLSVSDLNEGKKQLSSVVSMLIGFRKSTNREIRENPAIYMTGICDEQNYWFDHEKLDVYRRSLEFVSWCRCLLHGSGVSKSMQALLDKASTGVVLNIAEGNGKFSIKDRCRFIDYARNSALQAAATIDVLAVREVGLNRDIDEGKAVLSDIVSMLVAWLQSLGGLVAND
jgi:four helix bundle protein